MSPHVYGSTRAFELPARFAAWHIVKVRCLLYRPVSRLLNRLEEGIPRFAASVRYPEVQPLCGNSDPSSPAKVNHCLVNIIDRFRDDSALRNVAPAIDSPKHTANINYCGNKPSIQRVHHNRRTF